MARPRRTRRRLADELAGIERATSKELLADLGLGELTLKSCFLDLFGDLLEEERRKSEPEPEEPEFRVTQVGPPRREPKNEGD